MMKHTLDELVLRTCLLLTPETSNEKFKGYKRIFYKQNYTHSNYHNHQLIAIAINKHMSNGPAQKA